MIFQEHATIKQKLEVLSDAAKYDVACTSSGVGRDGKKEKLAIPCQAASAMPLVQTAGAFPC